MDREPCSAGTSARQIDIGDLMDREPCSAGSDAQQVDIGDLMDREPCSAGSDAQQIQKPLPPVLLPGYADSARRYGCQDGSTSKPVDA